MYKCKLYAPWQLCTDAMCVCGDSNFVIAAIQKTVLQEKQKVFQSSLEQLRQDHQAALESLTQKCLTLEDELGMFCLFVCCLLAY